MMLKQVFLPFDQNAEIGISVSLKIKHFLDDHSPGPPRHVTLLNIVTLYILL